MVERQSRAQIAEQNAHERRVLARMLGWRRLLVGPLGGLALSVAAFGAALTGALWR